jgi:hypothetical protein
MKVGDVQPSSRKRPRLEDELENDHQGFKLVKRVGVRQEPGRLIPFKPITPAPPTFSSTQGRLVGIFERLTQTEPPKANPFKFEIPAFPTRLNLSPDPTPKSWDHLLPTTSDCGPSPFVNLETTEQIASDEDESPTMSPYPRRSKSTTSVETDKDRSLTCLETVDDAAESKALPLVAQENKENQAPVVEIVVTTSPDTRSASASDERQSETPVSDEPEFKANSNSSFSPQETISSDVEESLDEDVEVGITEWPDIGATDGLVYNGGGDENPMDGGLFSPLGLRKALCCEESLQSPFAPSASKRTSVAPQRRGGFMPFGSPNLLTELEPVRSSPAFSKNPFEIFGGNSCFYNQDSESSLQTSFDFDDESPSHEAEHILDFGKYFDIQTGKSARWLEFNCERVTIPEPSNDGLVSPFEPVLRNFGKPNQPAVEDERLRDAPDEVTKEVSSRKDIWAALLAAETKYLPNPSYFCHQNLKNNSRRMLVDYIFSVAAEMFLHRQTVQMAINYLDRFFSKTTNIQMDLLQLISVVALYIAAKKEEVQAQSPQKYLELCCAPLLTIPQFNSIELKMMEILEWELTPPTYSAWLFLYLRNAAFDDPELFGPSYVTELPNDDVASLEHTINLEFYWNVSGLIDIFMHQEECLHYPMSLATAAALFVCLAEKTEAFDEEDDEMKGLIIYSLFN